MCTVEREKTLFSYKAEGTWLDVMCLICEPEVDPGILSDEEDPRKLIQPPVLAPPKSTHEDIVRYSSPHCTRFTERMRSRNLAECPAHLIP